MKNKLEPRIIRFEQISFEIDVDKQVLRQTNKPEHEISFITDMADMGDHYLLSWDTEKLTVSHDPDKAEPIVIDQLVRLDPEGMCAKYGIPVEKLQNMRDFEVIVDQEALRQRREGILPEIDLAGERFIVDLQLHELRHAKYFFPVISLKSFELTNDGWNYEAYYHPVIKQVVELDPKLLEFPEGVVKLKIPNELGLDPVATARMYGMDEREVLRRYPIQKGLKAEVIPLSETHIPALIQRNKEALRQAHQENAQKTKPRHRPRF
ncbi:hypothetical protein LX99_04258 [Mucilaginibacter oryzae]|uniref:Uncharacterized protein n=1 Tax=Mucilaginibacter oryzae TaxID=468058 RepID=A0A316H874_9SPHI|nr:hypothetical protein [Mucilaginibacter oryzae]PWK72928.1 hypothetical protein LX99_04258 [Mucilaginibacter oryzae]